MSQNLTMKQQEQASNRAALRNLVAEKLRVVLGRPPTLEEVDGVISLGVEAANNFLASDKGAGILSGLKAAHRIRQLFSGE